MVFFVKFCLSYLILILKRLLIVQICHVRKKWTNQTEVFYKMKKRKLCQVNAKSYPKCWKSKQPLWQKWFLGKYISFCYVFNTPSTNEFTQTRTGVPQNWHFAQWSDSRNVGFGSVGLMRSWAVNFWKAWIKLDSELASHLKLVF